MLRERRGRAIQDVLQEPACTSFWDGKQQNSFRKPGNVVSSGQRVADPDETREGWSRLWASKDILNILVLILWLMIMSEWRIKGKVTKDFHFVKRIDWLKVEQKWIGNLVPGLCSRPAETDMLHSLLISCENGEKRMHYKFRRYNGKSLVMNRVLWWAQRRMTCGW